MTDSSGPTTRPATPGSESISIGLSALRNAPIATSIAMSAMPRWMKDVSWRHSGPRSPMSRRAFRAARFPASSSAAARRPSCSRQPWRGFSRQLTMPGGRPRYRGHAGGQSHERRGRSLSRLSGRGGEPCLARCPSHGRHLLKALGRLHTAAEAMSAVQTAAAHFERYSFDLIYARPNQSASAWRAELKEAIARAAEHLSSTNSPSSPARRSSACMRPASLSHRTTTWRGHSMM